MAAGDHYERAYWARGLFAVAGVDEVGRGPLAGPLVAAAVVLRPEAPIDGLDDSKRLSAKKRETLYRRIVEEARAVAVGVASVEEIDRLGVAVAAKAAMRRALAGLSVVPEAVLVDAVALGAAREERAIIHGDRESVTIAAASIVAKVIRDRWMADWAVLYPAYGWEENAGYGTARHRQAIVTHGVTPLHRRTFLRRLLGEARAYDDGPVEGGVRR
ncbi:MAG: ribonuclease HII [Hydrogenibacillus sp.]|nr:ribonuclease HII [Hydrogenibacillus sp.]